ncbi:hypothetical protein HBB16_02260 [Pseudonocardia sp. MCCB 268]|nr:hypothetical protein [Pseudonocardia cytotoxica]
MTGKPRKFGLSRAVLPWRRRDAGADTPRRRRSATRPSGTIPSASTPTRRDRAEPRVLPRGRRAGPLVLTLAAFAAAAFAARPVGGWVFGHLGDRFDGPESRLHGPDDDRGHRRARARPEPRHDRGSRGPAAS